ncbi:hypothetical protein [Paenibacillus oryzisoli]|uniref:DUF1565 domain-containing protein n=1 Tax=Paenibacillus oryzisoli TaxID=1850517 RepID=A0A198A6R1_9BACL|nr:hypothetical protein [Paenibacillus oryzisoli]OAS17154.1 hypothetical protein A8708_02750 [Paenibacillus oryzisoli]
MSSTTTNVGLYKKNPSTDGNDTFDINTMLNDNWDKIDAQLGSQVGVSPPPTAVNLVNGMQVVNVPQSSPLNNLNIKGRTLVNLLGRDGNCEDVSRFTAGGTTLALDTTNKVNGNNSIKATLTSTAGTMQRVFNTISGNKYLIVGELKNGNATNVKVEIASLVSGNAVTSTTAFGISYATFGATGATHTAQVLVTGASTKYAYADCLRVYEITSTEKTYIDGLSVANAQAYIAAKYPYVDDVKHVNAPYVIKYGENLLPTFNEWAKDNNGNYQINEPYKVTLTNTINFFYVAPIVPSQQYSFSVNTTNSGGVYLTTRDINGSNVRTNFYISSGSVSTTFTAQANEVYVHVNFYMPSAGTYVYTNPMLNLGTTAQPFKPRNDDMLAFPNVQLASSVDGIVYDTLFKRDGKYFVESRFKKDVVLDGSLSWSFSSDYAGAKQVAAVGAFAASLIGVVGHRLVKYDGKIISEIQTATTGDQFLMWSAPSAGTLFVSIFDTDSGWGESYTPTAQEIQAYFYGWVMTTQESWSSAPVPYNGTGTKGWVRRWTPTTGGTPLTAGSIGTWVSSSGSGTLPTTASNGFTPYKLTYQLATPTFEEVAVEGSMTLHEGLNQIEVGQGIIVREKVVPIADLTVYHINNTAFPVCLLRNKTNRIYAIYKNGKLDSSWTIRTNHANGYGGGNAYTLIVNYDPTATYEVSYIALDQYLLSAPVQAVTGETASNLKTAVDLLSMNDADQDARISEAERLARQIYNVPQKTTAAMTLYVDGTNGADNNDGSSGMPFKTIQRAIDSIPQIVNHPINVFVAAGTYVEDVRIEGFVGKNGGVIYLTGDSIVSTSRSVSSIVVANCINGVVVTGFNITSTTTNSLSVVRSSFVQFGFMNLVSSSITKMGLYATMSVVFFHNSVISNKSDVLYADHGCRVSLQDSTGNSNVNGATASTTATISRIGTQPNATNNYGGVTSGVINPWGDNTQANRSRVSAASNTTQSISAATATKVTLQSVTSDNLTEFATSRFTTKSTGTYTVNAVLAFNSGITTSVSYSLILYKNGSAFRYGHVNNGTTYSSPIIPSVFMVDLVAGDFIEIYLTTSSATVLASGSTLEITRIA